MKPLSEITDALTLEQLQEQKNLRDAEVERLRSENLTIHNLMEPKWAAEQRLSSANVNLRQMIGGNRG